MIGLNNQLRARKKDRHCLRVQIGDEFIRCHSLEGFKKVKKLHPHAEIVARKFNR